MRSLGKVSVLVVAIAGFRHGIAIAQHHPEGHAPSGQAVTSPGNLQSQGPGAIEAERKRRAVRTGRPTPVVLPPEASGDSFETAHNTQLSESAPGVLANDTLHAASIAGYGATLGTEQTSLGANTPTRANGTVRMEADGSFVYNPAGGFAGQDAFRYVIANSGGSSSAEVTVEVAPETPVVDFFVTAPGFFYSFAGIDGQNPVLTLTRGRTYRFAIDTSPSHPFEILDAPPGSVTNNNIFRGTLVFDVPASADNYRYHCSLHVFGNDILTVPPPSTEDATAGQEQLEKNKRTVLAFYHLAFNEGRAREAMEIYGGDGYVHNDPAVPPGREGFISHFEDLARRDPGRRFELRSVVAERNLVAVHCLERLPGAGERSRIDIFRLDDDGRIVEHWGALQPGPPAAEGAD